MDSKEISAFLIGCKPEELMSFKDYGEDGAAAIGPDGKKYVFSKEYLDQAIPKLEAAAAAEQAAKPAAPAKRKAPAKPTSRGSGSKTKPATRTSSPRTTKPGGSRSSK